MLSQLICTHCALISCLPPQPPQPQPPAMQPSNMFSAEHIATCSQIMPSNPMHTAALIWRYTACTRRTTLADMAVCTYVASPTIQPPPESVAQHTRSLHHARRGIVVSPLLLPLAGMCVVFMYTSPHDIISTMSCTATHAVPAAAAQDTLTLYELYTNKKQGYVLEYPCLFRCSST